MFCDYFDLNIQDKLGHSPISEFVEIFFSWFRPYGAHLGKWAVCHVIYMRNLGHPKDHDTHVDRLKNLHHTQPAWKLM